MRVGFYSALLLAALAPLSAASSTPARADLKLCNFTPSRVGIAIGYKQGKQWITEGWWNVLSQSCETLVTGEMCTADKTFTIKGVKDCGGRGYKTSKFYEVDTGESKDYTVRLVDPQDGAATP
jgi:uncharacterized membrane protein